VYREGRHDRAFELLRTAVARDDSLRYDEPWGWMQPVRHALGALLLEQGRIEEAEAVYRQDLVRHPENGWALHGHKAWMRADVQLRGSCFCRRGS
jgi:hypothetical protein